MLKLDQMHRFTKYYKSQGIDSNEGKVQMTFAEGSINESAIDRCWPQARGYLYVMVRLKDRSVPKDKRNK